MTWPAEALYSIEMEGKMVETNKDHELSKDHCIKL